MLCLICCVLRRALTASTITMCSHNNMQGVCSCYFLLVIVLGGGGVVVVALLLLVVVVVVLAVVVVLLLLLLLLFAVLVHPLLHRFTGCKTQFLKSCGMQQGCMEGRMFHA